MRGFRFKLADYFIIGVLLLAGLAGLWYNFQQGSRLQQKYAVIYVDNRPVAELSLGQNDLFEYTIAFGDGHEAVLEIEEGKVRMLPMSVDLCPKGICSHTGWIAHPYESIVCLPNRIMVVFSSSPTESEEIDGVTY
jgi:hypothetical protein